MDDFNTPNTRPGYCPECDQAANIWDAKLNGYHCTYCNWFGSKPNQEKFIKTELA